MKLVLKEFIKLQKIKAPHRTIMKQPEMFKTTLSRILAFAKANTTYLAPSLCEIIGDDMPSTVLLQGWPRFSR
jgi:hypothetical protein